MPKKIIVNLLIYYVNKWPKMENAAWVIWSLSKEQNVYDSQESIRYHIDVRTVVGHLSNGLLSKPSIISEKFASKIVII